MINDIAAMARRIVMTTNANIFLTGRAGTGKTTFLRALKASAPKRMVVLAPTGIAAINAGGSTIHSFFQFSFAPFVPGSPAEDYKWPKRKIRLVRSLDLIVIDEISMVRADLLDRIDAVLRRYRPAHHLPFGGVQLLLIGDLQQLAPVAKDAEWDLLKDYYETPYFFSSKALRQTNFLTLELEHVYRQSDSDFLELLARVRNNTADAATLQKINERYVRGFRPCKDDGYIHLVTHNGQARRINQQELDALPGHCYTFRARVEGNFPETSFPTDAELKLKLGAQIMFVKNDSEHRYYNGSIGHVVDIDDEGFCVKLANSQEVVAVAPAEWENTRYELNERSKSVEEKWDGSFCQFPVKTAWAITIHKSQGLTFDKAIVDASAAFAHGQTYVALSRLRTLQGLVLSSPLPAAAIINDEKVVAFSQEAEAQKPTDGQIVALSQNYAIAVLDELFDIRAIAQPFARLLRICSEHFFRQMPASVSHLQVVHDERLVPLVQVAARFHDQYARLIEAGTGAEAEAALQNRLAKGCAYFREQLLPVCGEINKFGLTAANKELQKRIDSILDDLRLQLQIRVSMMAYVEAKGFEVSDFVKHRGELLAATEVSGVKRSGQKGQAEALMAAPKRKKLKVESDKVCNEELLRILKQWRKERAKASGLPVYTMIRQQGLIGIVNLMPRTIEALMLIPYVGKRTAEKYGEEILEILEKYRRENI